MQLPAHRALLWRPATAGDVPAWQRLVHRIERHDATAQRLRRQELHDLLLVGSWKRPQQESVLGLDRDGEPRAFGHVARRAGPERRRRVFCWGGVDPALRRRGIGAAVLAWQERVARVVAAGAPGEDGDVLRVHGEAEDEALRRLVLAAGFRSARTYLVMARELMTAPLDGAVGGPVQPIPYRPHDAETVRRLHNEAFAAHWGSEPRSREEWERRTTGSSRFRPEWSRLMLAGEHVVGYAVCSRAPASDGGPCTGVIDALGVLPHWRGTGVARALLADVLRTMHRDGVRRAVLDVDAENTTGARRLYDGLGFVEQRRRVAYVKAL